MTQTRHPTQVGPPETLRHNISNDLGLKGKLPGVD
jgi:hypothetical protein